MTDRRTTIQLAAESLISIIVVVIGIVLVITGDRMRERRGRNEEGK